MLERYIKKVTVIFFTCSKNKNFTPTPSFFLSHLKMPKEIFKSPVRRSNTNPVTAPLSEYVDYTPRRDLTAQDLDHNPNSISYAKERRTQYYQQMALESEDPLGDVNYMDSPIVRRHYGIDYSPPSYFDNKMRQALDQDFLSR